MARPGIALKDPLQERHLFRSRAVVAAVLVVALMGALIARLYFLQVVRHSHFTTLSHENRVSIQPIAPTRGLIYDRNGAVLAQNVPTFSLEIIPEQVPDMEATLQAINALIGVGDSDISRFRAELKRHRGFEGVPLRFRLNEEEVARIAVNRPRLPGVEITSRLARHYPYGELTAHIVGYVGRIDERELKRVDPSDYSGTSHIGKVGVEYTYEDELHGKVGLQQVETNARGRTLRVLDKTPPVPGKDLVLNIDVKVQQDLKDAFGEERGALVAIDPTNGAVVALVSTPSYDPNLFVNGISQTDYEALTTNPDQPLYNRALRGQYPPGSTTKPFVGLAGLELGVTTADERIWCPGYFQLPGQSHKYRDWKRGGHGATDLHKSIVESCDVYYYEVARRLGIDALSAFMQRFGFGHLTGVDLTGERPGIMPTRDWKRRTRKQPWYPGETVITGIGQGFVLATPLQLANATATLSVGGIRYEPRVVAALINPITGERTPLIPKVAERIELRDPKHLESVRSAMVDVVHSSSGTARRIVNEAYTIAGKTGTAQVFSLKQDERYREDEVEKRLRDHALFVAFAPAEHPHVAVAVMVENGGHGGSVAAPIARQVMDSYLTSNPEFLTSPAPPQQGSAPRKPPTGAQWTAIPPTEAARPPATQQGESHR